MRSLKEISDRQIIRFALFIWGAIALGSLITNHLNFAASSVIAIALGLYGLRVMRKRNSNNTQN